MRTIKELEAEIETLDKQIQPLSERRSECEGEILKLKSPFKVGDVITWGDRGETGEVKAILEWCCGDPMWKVENIRKDGSRGKTRMVRHYQKPRLANEKAAHEGFGWGDRETVSITAKPSRHIDKVERPRQ